MIEAFKRKEDWKLLAKQLNINKFTARSIISKFEIEINSINITPKVREHKPFKISEEVKQSLRVFINKNRLATLKQMQIFVKETHQLEVCQSTINNFLKREKYP